MSLTLDEAVEIYAEAWKKSFEGDNKFEVVDYPPELKKHIKAGLEAVLEAVVELERSMIVEGK